MNIEILSTLAGATISLISSFLVQGFAKKTGEIVGEKVGQKALEKTADLYKVVKTKFSKRGETRKTFEKFEQSPADPDIKSSVHPHLMNMLESDETFVRELIEKIRDASDSGADAVFQTTIAGDVKNLVQVGNVFGNLNIN